MEEETCLHRRRTSTERAANRVQNCLQDEQLCRTDTDRNSLIGVCFSRARLYLSTARVRENRFWVSPSMVRPYQTAGAASTGNSCLRPAGSISFFEYLFRERRGKQRSWLLAKDDVQQVTSPDNARQRTPFYCLKVGWQHPQSQDQVCSAPRKTAPSFLLRTRRAVLDAGLRRLHS